MTESHLHDEDLKLVRDCSGRNHAARRRLAGRMLCVRRMLAAKNRSAGSPLDEDELEDVVQDSLALLWSKRARYEGRAAIESWAYQVGLFEWLNAIRRKRSRAYGRQRFADDYRNASGEIWPPRPDVRGLVLESLGELDDPDGLVIRRKHFDDVSLREIGASLNVPTNTVKFWYYRGLGTLRHRLLPLISSRRHECG